MGRQIDMLSAIIIAVLLSALTGLVVWIVKDEKNSNMLTAVPEPASTSITESGEGSAGGTNVDVPGSKNPVAQEAGKYPGWKTYTSQKYGYTIKYPSAGTGQSDVTEAKESDFGLPVDSGMTFSQAFAKYTGEICVSINTKFGHINISAPENKDNYVICGLTGIGSETKVSNSSGKITISGKEYEYNIMDMKSPNSHTVYCSVKLDDQTAINFSSSPENQDNLKKVVETFQKIK